MYLNKKFQRDMADLLFASSRHLSFYDREQMFTELARHIGAHNKRAIVAQGLSGNDDFKASAESLISRYQIIKYTEAEKEMKRA